MESIFDHDYFNELLKPVLRNWSDNDLDAILSWIQENPENVKEFVELYDDALENFLEQP